MAYLSESLIFIFVSEAICFEIRKKICVLLKEIYLKKKKILSKRFCVKVLRLIITAGNFHNSFNVASTTFKNTIIRLTNAMTVRAYFTNYFETGTFKLLMSMEAWK